jgi:hypothetical protein
VEEWGLLVEDPRRKRNLEVVVRGYLGIGDSKAETLAVIFTVLKPF